MAIAIIIAWLACLAAAERWNNAQLVALFLEFQQEI